jgi:hypothetical protein
MHYLDVSIIQVKFRLPAYHFNLLISSLLVLYSSSEVMKSMDL